jgi:hypothetical protein
MGWHHRRRQFQDFCAAKPKWFRRLAELFRRGVPGFGLMGKDFTIVTARKRPAAGLIQTAGRHEIRVVARETLEHTEHDRADKGESDIGGDNAQSVEQGTKGHCQTSQIHFGVHDAARTNAKVSKPFHAKKVSLAVHPSLPVRAVSGNVVKES